MSTFRRRMLMMAKEVNPSVEDKTTAFYNITDISQSTALFNNNGYLNVEYYVVDNTITVYPTNDDSRNYMFSTIGEHSVKFQFKDNTKIPNNFFRSVQNITKIIVPNNITGIGMSCAYGCSVTEWIIGSGVTSIGIAWPFGSIQKMTIYAATPPTLGASTSLTGNYPIYVPSASVALYQAADYWKNHPIYAITE